MSQNSQLENKKKKAKENKARIKEKIKEEKKKLEQQKRQDKELGEALQIKELDQEEDLPAKTDSEKRIAGTAEGNTVKTVTVNHADAKEEKARTEESVPVKETVRTEEAVPAKETKDKKERGGGKRLMPALVLAAAAAVFAGIAFVRVQNQRTALEAENAAIEAMVHMEAVELAEYSQTQHKRERMKDQLRKEAGKDAARALTDAAGYMIHGMRNRPPEIKLTEENTADFATIESCVINSETGKIDITMSAPGLAVSDDGYYYLFEEKTYETALNGEDYIIEDQKDVDLTFSVNLNYNTVGSRLFSKFVVAVRKDGEFVAISEPKYITNPEAIARYSPSFSSTKSKKGLLVDPEKLAGSELEDLGVKHAAYNIPLSRILGFTTNEIFPTVTYSYNGKNYYFNGQIVDEYDYIFSTLTNKGITTTAIILNDISYYTGDLIHPLARSGGKAPYYAFNAADAAGSEYLAAVASFLASRYSGNGHGVVMNWIIGNEINARNEWNYIQYMDTESYVEEYAKAFRIFYNAILSINANARVYLSIDQQWGKSLYSNNGYGSKEIVDEFNRNIKNGGNIDWGVAQHPYNYPLTSARAWSTAGRAGTYILDSETTPVISIRNIHVLTDYLQKEELLTDSGEVRHVILSEIGYTSLQGQDLQAASFVYAYKVIEANQYIDSMLFSRETDATLEINQGLALGICTLEGSRKSIYDAYKYVDTDQSAAHTDFALRIIGVSSWGEVVKNH
ncbi:MAG: DUF5722 domain-containing protein [Blautia sp.]|nr:DUF5722 domain-containing protein [Blautia sp.]MCM1200294.1 DUF5722 domain-containing protein [Bacteroides fragilis]